MRTRKGLSGCEADWARRGAAIRGRTAAAMRRRLGDLTDGDLLGIED
jgi:hypothetical protein